MWANKYSYISLKSHFRASSLTNFVPQGSDTALHKGLFKYLISQDTRFCQTPYKHNRTISSLGILLSFQYGSTIKDYKFFFCIKITHKKENKYSTELGTTWILVIPLLSPNLFTQSTKYLGFKCMAMSYWHILPILQY